jgi:hypothetical protein
MKTYGSTGVAYFKISCGHRLGLWTLTEIKYKVSVRVADLGLGSRRCVNCEKCVRDVMPCSQ